MSDSQRASPPPAMLLPRIVDRSSNKERRASELPARRLANKISNKMGDNGFPGPQAAPSASSLSQQLNAPNQQSLSQSMERYEYQQQPQVRVAPWPQVKRGQPTLVAPEMPEPMLLVCAVLCRVCRSLVPIVDGLAAPALRAVSSSEENDGVETFNDSMNNGYRRYEVKQTAGNGVVKCSRCSEATPVRVAPEGKRFIRCVCGCLFVTKFNTRRLSCPRETCHRYLEITTPGNL